jgi:hypothetical protein
MKYRNETEPASLFAKLKREAILWAFSNLGLRRSYKIRVSPHHEFFFLAIADINSFEDLLVAPIWAFPAL